MKEPVTKKNVKKVLLGSVMSGCPVASCLAMVVNLCRGNLKLK